jgi:hypothetical protein
MSAVQPAPLIGWIGLVAIALVLALSTAPKIFHPRLFSAVIAEYDILPSNVALPTAWTVIGLQIAAVTAILSGALLLGGALSVGLFITFLGAIAINLHRGRSIPCGCFLAYNDRITVATAIRALVLLLLAAMSTALVATSTLTGLIEKSSKDGPVLQLTWIGASALGVLLVGTWLFTVWSVRRLLSPG